jgi:hypothetical protein
MAKHPLLPSEAAFGDSMLPFGVLCYVANHKGAYEYSKATHLKSKVLEHRFR